MRLIAFLLLAGFIAPTAHGDLLERIKLEDSVRARVEDAFRLYDPDGRALIRFEFKSFSGTLPGTALPGTNAMPVRPDISDVARVRVEIFSRLNEIPAEAKDVILQVIPVDKSRVQVEYKTYNLPQGQDLPRALDSQSFAHVMESTASEWTLSFGLALALCLLTLIGFLFHQNRQQLHEFKTQIGLLTNALSDLSLGGAPAPSHVGMAAAAGPASPSPSGSSENPFENFSATGLKELLADCYWCEEDGYAVWIWKSLSAEQRRELLSTLPFMKSYSTAFMDVAPREASYHEHPFYLDPSDWIAYSQEDSAEVVRQDPTAWHSLSPMRQKNLPLPFSEKLAAIQSEPPVKAKPAKPAKQSPPRALKAKPTWGDLTIEDEAALYSRPEMVPADLRPSVKSLVWLARRDDNRIVQALSRFDARSLASAWIGPDDVLNKLGSHLPEKKRKLVETYAQKSPASRHSPAFLALVDEGIRDEAA